MMNHLIVLLLCIFVHSVKICSGQKAVGNIQLQRMNSDKPCRNSADCEEHSYCYFETKKCKCDPGYLVIKNQTNFHYQCLFAAVDLDSDCIQDVQCQYLLGLATFCDLETKKCKCMEGAHYDKGESKCYNTSAYGQSCIQDRQCLNPDGGYAYCIEGKCACADSQYLTENMNCVKKVKLGEPCEKDDNCAWIQGYCNMECKCGNKYVISGNKEECLKAALNFGENCTELAQCTTFLSDSVCMNNTCVCSSGRHPIDHICYLSTYLGQKCQTRQECWVDGLGASDVDCMTGVCTCISEKCRRLQENGPNSSNGFRPALFLILISFVSFGINVTF